MKDTPAAALCLSEVESKLREQLISTALIKSGPAGRVPPSSGTPPLIKRQGAKRRGLSCTFPQSPCEQPPCAAAPHPGPQLTPQRTDPASPPWSSSRLPYASAPTCEPPSSRLDPRRPQAGPRAPPPPLAHPSTAERSSQPWLDKSLCNSHTPSFRRWEGDARTRGGSRWWLFNWVGGVARENG